MLALSLLFSLLRVESGWGQTVVSYTTPGTYSWVCPAGVTSVTVQAWGAGGAGGGGGGDAGREVGRGALRVRGAQPRGPAGERGGADRVGAHEDAALPGAQADHLRGHRQDLHGQGAEESA